MHRKRRQHWVLKGHGERRKGSIIGRVAGLEGQRVMVGVHAALSAGDGVRGGGVGKGRGEEVRGGSRVSLG